MPLGKEDVAVPLLGRGRSVFPRSIGVGGPDVDYSILDRLL